MKKNNFITKYDDSVLEGTYETFTRPSMTEPDNAMSIPEIIARFTRGYGIDVQQHPWTTGSAFEEESPEEFWNDFIPAAPAAPAADPAPADPAAPAAPAADPAPADPAAKPAQEA